MLKKDLRKLIEGTSDAAYVVNSEGVVVAWNKAAQKLFGVSAQQAIGQACRTIVQGIDRQTTSSTTSTSFSFVIRRL